MHSTVKRCTINPFTYDQVLKDHDLCTLVPLKGIPVLNLKHAVFKNGPSAGIKVTVGAHRNGMGSVCTLMSTEYHANHWDIIPKHDYDLELYKTDQDELHKKGFKVCGKRLFGENQFSSSLFNDYYLLFCLLPIDMVTTSQGSNE